MDEWLESAVQYLITNWGISAASARKGALLYAYLYLYGLKPTITSGFRDPEKQKALRARWDSGDRQGLVVRPAANSDHTRVDWLGRPASEAIDITCSNPALAGQIAKALGIIWGGNYSTPDPVHFDLGNGEQKGLFA